MILRVILNGSSREETRLTHTDWRDVSVALVGLPEEQTFVLEIQLDAGVAEFDRGGCEGTGRSVRGVAGGAGLTGGEAGVGRAASGRWGG